MDRQWRRGSLVGPLILIAAGVIFLLNNIGYLSWDIWLVLVRLWPLFLIAIGLDILIGRRSLLGSIIVVILVALLFVGGIWYLTGPGGRTGQGVTTQEINQPLRGATRAEVEISPGIGTLHLGALESGDTLIQGTLALATDETIRQNFDISGDTARYQLRTRESPFLPFFALNSSRLWNLKLSSTIPLSLKVSAGVGDNNLELEQLKLTGLDLSAGVGRISVTLPSHGKFQAHLSGGVGETVVRIPATLATRLRLSTGLGQTDVPPAFRRQGDLYLSPNYDSAGDSADLDVSAGVGKVTIQQFGNQ